MFCTDFVINEHKYRALLAVNLYIYIYIYIIYIYMVNSHEYGTNPGNYGFCPLPAHSDWFLCVCGIVQMRLGKSYKWNPTAICLY